MSEDLNELQQRVADLETKVSHLYAILQRAELNPNAGGVSDEVLLLLQRDQKIEAIKLHREQTGLGLAEAKEAVERYEATG